MSRMPVSAKPRTRNSRPAARKISSRCERYRRLRWPLRGLFTWLFGNFILQRSNDGKIAGSFCLPSVHLRAAYVKGF